MASNNSTSSNPPRAFPLLDRRPSFIGRNINQPIDNFLSTFRRRRGGNTTDSCEGSFETYVPPIPYDASGAGTPNFKYKSLLYYKELLCDWCYAIPHSSQWVVFIEPHNSNYLNSQLVNMKEYEPWYISDDWDFDDYVNKLNSTESQDRIGCIFCMGVSEAGIQLDVEHKGGVGGYINGFSRGTITAGRSDHQPLEMVFRETNCSYSQYVIRPWITLAGHKGLHARPQSEDIKAQITVFQLGQTDGIFDSNIIRKAMVYHECVPISLNDENLDYEGAELIQRQVSWAYSDVTVRNMNEISLLGGEADIT